MDEDRISRQSEDVENDVGGSSVLPMTNNDCSVPEQLDMRGDEGFDVFQGTSNGSVSTTGGNFVVSDQGSRGVCSSSSTRRGRGAKICGGGSKAGGAEKGVEVVYV